MARSACGTGMVVCATILGPVVMVLLAISFATDHWLYYDVDQSLIGATNRLTDVSVARYTTERHRGMWRECYPTNETQWLDLADQDDLVDKHCFFVKYGIPDERPGQDWSSEYISRIHLMRCWMAFFIVAMVFFLVAYIFGLVLCCWRQSKWAYVAGLCAYIAAFCTAASIAFFHGAEYLEKNKITDYDPYTGYFYPGWSADIQRATDRSYGYSYIIGWIAMFFAALTATFYSIAGCYIGGERYEDKEYLDKGRSREYLERSYPMPLEPPHKDYYYGYPYQGYQGPYLYDLDSRQQLPALTYGPEAGSTWKWH